MIVYPTHDGGKVTIQTGDHIAIYDASGEEVVRWVADEFEDPEAATAAANAVAIALQRGAGAVRKRIS